MAASNGDGNDVSEVLKLATTATNLIRRENGPVFLNLTTYRWLEHCGPNDDDYLNYRKQFNVKFELIFFCQ